ncbi:hypothetical protein H5410_051696 [Solanum commersonii]|uniref:DUF7746 domain-containing protein n=1 Tax=Solanum commersonii TaxID=4109 RepID=A0A9J5X0U5_SOLCO|nr:hypothetical protein H5410_051696 [Solanum commersonii]
MCRMIDIKNETILIETNFDKFKVVTRRPIQWDEIDFPQEWVIEGATQPKNNINDEVTEIEQFNDGTVKIKFSDPIAMHNISDNHSMSSRLSTSNSSYISHVDYIVQVPSRASTSQIRENYRCDNIKIDRDNIARPMPKLNNTALLTAQHINIMIKQQNYANIYMSILGEHITSIHDNVDKLLSRINFNTKGKEKVANASIQPPPEIGDFKLKDFSNLESLLEKKFKGCNLKPLGVDDLSGGESSYKKEFSDEINKISEKYTRKPVQRMYYYPRPTPQDEIYEWNIDGYTDRQIYTTVHRMLMYNTICKANKNSDKTIADMITTRFTGQLKGWWDNYLNTEQRDKILQAVKKKGEQNLTQNVVCKTLTSFKFYKDVFLSRVIELLECNSSHWKSKFIDGLPALCAKRVRKTLRGDSHKAEYSSHEESSTSEDLKALHQEDYMLSDDDCLPCQQRLSCEKEGEENDLYKIYSQFKELSMNVIDNDKVIELLQIVEDPEIRAQIIDKIRNTSTSQNHIIEDVPTKEGSYTMAEVKNLLFERRKLISSPTTISDLKQEINNLKNDIHRLKEKNVIIEIRLDNIESLKDLSNSSESSSYEGDSKDLDFLKTLNFGNNKEDFLQSLKAITSQNMRPSWSPPSRKGKGGKAGSGRGNILAQMGNQKLIAANIAFTSGLHTDHPMYKEFLDFMQSKQGKDNFSQSYSTVLTDEENIEIFDQNDKKEVMLLLEQSDLR